MQLWIWLGKYHFNSDIRNFISHITYYSLIFFIVNTFNGQVHVFSGWVKIVSHSSFRTIAILKYFCPLLTRALASCKIWKMMKAQTWSWGYKTFIMLNSTEDEISTPHKKLKYRQMKMFLALSLSDNVFIMLINVKMPTIVGILTFMSRKIFVLSWDKHKKNFNLRARI